MVLLKIVPIDGGEGKYTHTYMHVKNIKPGLCTDEKIRGPHAFPSPQGRVPRP
jgi:hypothetical protein